jgi:TonB family protein
MKKCTLFLAALFAAFHLLAQGPKLAQPDCGVYRNPVDLAPVIDFNPGIPPTFTGGDSAMQVYMKMHMKQNFKEFKMLANKTVTVAFVIDTSGQPCNIYVSNLNGNDSAVGKSATRVICNMPKWNPGIFKGPRNRKMAVKITIDVFFGMYKGKKMKIAPSLKMHVLGDKPPQLPPQQDPNRPKQNPPQQPPLNVTVEPSFPGGDSAMLVFIKSNIVYPEAEKKAKKSGTVIVGFIVSQDGRVEYPYIVEEIPGAPGLSTEAMRIVSQMPRWNAGSIKGVTSRMIVKVSVTFVLPK